MPALIDPVLDDAARIVITFNNEAPLDLLEFTASLTALAQDYQAMLRKTRPTLPINETRLLVVDIRPGSTIIELLPDFIKSAGVSLIPVMEYTNTVVEFVKNIRDALTALSLPGGRVEGGSTVGLKHLSEMVQVVATERSGNLSVAAQFKDGTSETKIAISSEEARIVIKNVDEQIIEIEDKRGSLHKKVAMRLHQTSVGDLTVNKKTTEKGTIERIDNVPRQLIYVSDLAGQRIKDEITKADANPYQKIFIVDVDVESV